MCSDATARVAILHGAILTLLGAGALLIATPPPGPLSIHNAPWERRKWEERSLSRGAEGGGGRRGRPRGAAGDGGEEMVDAEGAAEGAGPGRSRRGALLTLGWYAGYSRVYSRV